MSSSLGYNSSHVNCGNDGEPDLFVYETIARDTLSSEHALNPSPLSSVAVTGLGGSSVGTDVAAQGEDRSLRDGTETTGPLASCPAQP